MFTHQKSVLNDKGKVEKKSWQVDVHALERLQENSWIEEFPQLLQKDLAEMSSSFPHWFLALGKNAEFVVCANDQEYIVAKKGGWHCLKCDQPYSGVIKNLSLIWTGMLPVQITGANKVENHVRKKIQNETIRIPFLDNGKALYLMVPIKIVYPNNWPNYAPSSFYISVEFFRSIGVSAPGASHANHMKGSLEMCLFSSWHHMSIREVIQNRIIPHALAQVKIANDERPKKWFN